MNRPLQYPVAYRGLSCEILKFHFVETNALTSKHLDTEEGCFTLPFRSAPHICAPYFFQYFITEKKGEHCQCYSQSPGIHGFRAVPSISHQYTCAICEALGCKITVQPAPFPYPVHRAQRIHGPSHPSLVCEGPWNFTVP